MTEITVIKSGIDTANINIIRDITEITIFTATRFIMDTMGITYIKASIDITFIKKIMDQTKRLS
jgi:hypothetical protein